MEIRVYASLSHYSAKKALYCRRIEIFDDLKTDFSGILKVMRLLYGSSCIVEFLCVD